MADDDTWDAEAPTPQAPPRRSVASLKDLPLRRGKWTADEQNYSEALIQNFLAGVVPDCSDGTTLRAFLSNRLHCAGRRGRRMVERLSRPSTIGIGPEQH